MKKILTIFLVLLLATSVAVAHEHDFAETKKLIDSGIGCDELTDEQLEEIGDYYMEQMHPGEAHEIMDEMMGGEGSESLRQMHINMARRIYCREDVGGMMGSGGMMGGGMMNMMSSGGMMGSGGTTNTGGGSMMGYFSPFSWSGMGFGFIFMIIFWGLIIWLIVWLITKYAKPQQTSESAMEILKKRFAKGEITKKQYDDMKQEIS